MDIKDRKPKVSPQPVKKKEGPPVVGVSEKFKLILIEIDRGKHTPVKESVKRKPGCQYYYKQEAI